MLRSAARPWQRTIPRHGPAPPTLDLSFMTGTLPTGVTFTRASTATYFNSAGTMQTSALNIWLQSADASNAAWQKSGSVVAAPTVTGNQMTAPDGTVTAAQVVYPAVSGASAISVLAQHPVTSSNAYTFSVYLRGNAGGEQLYVMATPDAVTYYRTPVTLTTSWQRFSVLETSAAGQIYFQIGVDLRDGSQTSKPAQTIFVWGGQVEQGNTATNYIATTTAANGAPRWDYNPSTLALNGLLIEQASTNLQFPSTNWTANATVSSTVDGVTQNAGVAPDGTSAAMLFVPSGASSAAHQNFTLFTGAVSTAYVHTIYAKPAGYSYLAVSLENSGFTTRNVAHFDLANGVVASGGNATGTIQAVGNGWFRLSVAATSASTTGSYVAAMRVFNTLANLTSELAFAGDMVSGVLLWGKQVEAGPVPTSYIPTTSAAVTRAQEVATMPTGAWFNATTGSAAVNLILPTVNTVSANIAILAMDAGTAANTIELRQQGGYIVFGVAVFVASASAANLFATGSFVANVVSKCAATYGPGNTISGLLNAGPIGSASPTSMPTPTRFTFGLGRNQMLNGYLQRVRYWPRVLSNTELQQVTT